MKVRSICNVQGVFRCSIDAAQQQMALYFEFVVSDQFFSVVLATYKWFKISAPGVWRQHMWQLDGEKYLHRKWNANGQDFEYFTTVQLRTGKGFHYQQAQKWLRFKGLFGLVRPSHYSVCTVFTSYLEIRSNTMKQNWIRERS